MGQFGGRARLFYRPRKSCAVPWNEHPMMYLGGGMRPSGYVFGDAERVASGLRFLELGTSV